MAQLKGCIAPVSKLTGEGKGTQSLVAMFKLLEEVVPDVTVRQAILTSLGIRPPSE